MKVQEEIASGGFGRVERVLLDDETEAARKVFSPVPQIVKAVGRDRLLLRFRREVKYQSSLPDDLFIPVLAANLETDTPWFIMPLAESNLATEIVRCRAAGEIPLEALRHILESLSWLHERDFVHRDIKPENVLLHQGRWKLSDFGLILPPDDKTATLTTMHGFGSEKYCAPEQRMEFKKATAASDIYSFGCVLHDVYDGSARLPYQKVSCKGPMCVVIERCTELDPKKRFKSADGLLDALLTVHAAPIDVEPTPQAKELAERLEAMKPLTPGELTQLVKFLEKSLQEGKREDAWPVFAALSEDAFAFLSAADIDLTTEHWPDIARSYCEWARGGFPFEYCDVVARRLKYIFSTGHLAIKAEAAMAAAELGRSHNRWFVMGTLLEMCGHGLETNTAQRIAVEILATESQSNFKQCATVIHRTVHEYHPLIAAVLKDDVAEA